MSLLLDTHAVIWALAGDKRLGRRAKKRIADSPQGTIAIADITLLEISMLVGKGRIEINEATSVFLEEIASKFLVLPINAAIAADAVDLPLPQGDPFDRIIVATARNHGLDLATKDKSIVASATVKTIW